MNSLRHQILDVALAVAAFVKPHRLLCPVLCGEGLILVMHRVVPEKSYPRIAANSRIEITLEFLEELINYFVSIEYEIISLDSVYQRLTDEVTGRPFVCFTFDDGYVDIFDNIHPLFMKYQLPYAVYVVSDFPDRKSVLWWYMLEDLVLQHNALSFRYAEQDFSFKTRNATEKEAAYAKIRELILSGPQDQMTEVLDAVFSPYSITAADYNDLQMNWNQVVELSREPLVTIGAHTVHHYNLKQLTADQVRWEIQTSKERLEEKIGRPIEHFAYPYGSRDEVGKREFDLAAESDFKTMVTVREGNIFSEHAAHLSCLPRVEITGRHQNLTLVDVRRCGVVSLLRHGLSRVITE